MYLKDRRSIVLNHNPFLTFHDDTRNPSQVSTYYFYWRIHFIIIIIIVLQADRAAQIIWSAVRFRNSLFDNVLRPEVYHLNPTKSDKDWFNLLR